MTNLLSSAERVVAVLAVVVLCACTPAGPAVSTAPSLAPSMDPTATPRPAVTHTASPAVTPSRVPSPAASAGISLTGTFVSKVNGITVSHPGGWSVQAATQPWTTAMLPLFREPFGDFIYDPSRTDHLFLGIASQPMGAKSLLDWAGPIMSGHGCGPAEPITIEGNSGIVSPSCLFAATSSAGRGYMIVLHVTDDEPGLRDEYDLAVFEQILATVQLHPTAQIAPSTPVAGQDEQRAAHFRVPFSYVLPSEPFVDYGMRTSTWWEFVLPTMAYQPGASLTVQVVEGGKSDACDSESAAVPLAPGPQGVIDYLKRVPQLVVSSEFVTTVGDVPAIQARVSRSNRGCDGPLSVWPETAEGLGWGAPASRGYERVLAVEVSGEHLLFTVSGESEYPGWTSVATQLINSIRFDTD